jgi:hypothetical protein
MKEIIELSFEGMNYPFTILLVLILLYWVTVILGVLDMDFLDVDLDADLSADVDVDTSVEIDGGVGDVMFLNNILEFLNIRYVPLMFFLSFFTLSGWFISIIGNKLLGDNFLLGLGLFIPNIIISSIIGKIFTQPFVKVFKKMKIEEKELRNAVGKIVTVTLDADDNKLGQGEIEVDRVPELIMFKCTSGTSLNKGEKALVLELIEAKNYYIVEPYID